MEVIGGSGGRRRPLPEWADVMDSTWRSSTVNVYPKRRHRDEAIVEEDVLIDEGEKRMSSSSTATPRVNAVLGDIPPPWR